MRERFAVLDGLRGVAAIIVLVFHLVQQQTFEAISFAGLAVDFFYVLSGFVVAFAYEQRLMSGDMSCRQFFGVRFKRLYPLIFLGTGIGIALGLVAAVGKGTVSPAEIGEAGVLGLLLLPSFVFPQWSTAYPFNMAAWSLTFEGFANVVYAIIVKYLTKFNLIIVVSISAIALVWLAWKNLGIQGGNEQHNWAGGFIRVLYPFFVGVLMFRCRPKMRHGTLKSVALMLLIPILLLISWPSYQIVSAVYVLIVFPLIVYAGSGLIPAPKVAKCASFMGALSYPIYILQGPILRIGEEMLKHLQLTAAGAVAFALVEGLAVAAFSYLGLKLFDEPIQKALSGMIDVPSALPLSQRP